MTATSSSERPCRVLIVDDQQTHRQKLTRAINHLGHQAATAVDGKDALLKLRKQAFDLVLLDILMPEVDGFDVLSFMQRDSSLREIPVIVISALDNETDSVVRAIEFGARDFLPKNVDLVLLRARVESSLASKRHRDAELIQLQRIERLTDAAAILEHSHVHPLILKLEDINAREDAIGQLSRVFTDMAAQAFERERRLRRQVRTLRSTALLMGVGAIFGLSIPISRIAAEQVANPLGIALWVNTLCAIICLSIATYRGTLPRMTRANCILFALWGLLGTLFGEVVLFAVAAFLEASLIAIVVVAEGFLVFAFASAMGIEQASLRRLTGFVTGFLGLSLVMFTVHQMDIEVQWVWGMLALVVPVSYALRTLLLTTRLPSDMDLVGAVGYSAVAGALIVLPIAWLTNDLVTLSLHGPSGNNTLLFAILLLAIISAAGTALRAALIKNAGAVFSSQSSLVTTLAGVAWSMLLLGERLPLTGWLALALMLSGVYLVGPKHEAEDSCQLAAKPDVEL